MISAVSCIGIAEINMMSTSNIAAIAFSSYKETPFKNEFGSLASFLRGYRMASDNTSLRSRGGSKRMGVLDQRYCNLPCGIACMYRKAPTSNGSTFLLIYRDSVFADHACFCLVGVHVFSHLTFRPFGCWMLV